MTRPAPPLLAFTAALAQAGLARRAYRPNLVRAAVALAVASPSGFIAGSAAGLFRDQRVPDEGERPGPVSVLSTSGANSLSRHPLYVGLSGILLANSVRLGSWKALLPAAVFALVIDRLHITAEEAALESDFGSEYESYRSTVPRWLGLRSVMPVA